MVRAVDESVKNITATYQSLGLLDDTVIILTGDNGGQPLTGGNVYPLRGNKATTFEGGLRSIAFISGAGLCEAVKGTISHEIMHVTDWLPTLVAGVAGVDLSNNATGRDCPSCTREIPVLDGANACNGHGTCNIPGSGAIRIGRWKLLHGHQGTYGTVPTASKNSNCVERNTANPQPKSFPFPIAANETGPWCPLGWTPPPRADGHYELPIPPADAGCSDLPCEIGSDSEYITGRTMLFDLEADPFEHEDVAASNPAVV